MQAFDDLLLLKRGGFATYVGHLGTHSVDLVNYFQQVKGVPPLRKGINPATWMLEVSTLNKEHELGVDFADIYRNSTLYKCAQPAYAVQSFSVNHVSQDMLTSNSVNAPCLRRNCMCVRGCVRICVYHIDWI